MIKNDLSKYSRMLLSFAALILVLLLSGCCDFCNKDVLYTFDIPEGQADCPAGTTFTNLPDDDPLDPISGGGGVVERSGGAGVVDRQGHIVGTWCQIDCDEGQIAGTGNPQIEWNSGSDVVVASVSCG